MSVKRILGLDPGLEHTGWGIIEQQGSTLTYVACGRVSTQPSHSPTRRLCVLAEGISVLLAEHKPTHGAIEEVFVNSNARSSLKLGQARGVVLLAAAQTGLELAEYTPLKVKQSLVGYGRAEKSQVAHMVKMLLPKATPTNADAADALAIAICHAHST